jgi:hypothetical protein
VWCDAKVVKVRSGHAAVRELRVHFHQWNSRFDEWIRVGEGRLQSGGAPPQGTQAPDDAAESEDEAESSDTVSISWERVSTRCAVSAQRLDDPAKGCHCNHRAKINYAVRLLGSGPHPTGPHPTGPHPAPRSTMLCVSWDRNAAADACVADC